MCLGSPANKCKEKLNSVQAFASKVIWTAPQQQRLSILKWPCLKDRCEVQKLILCSKIINDQSYISPSTFSQHHYPMLRHSQFSFVCTTDSFSFLWIFLFYICCSFEELFPLNYSIHILPVTFKSHVVAYICINSVSLYLFLFLGKPLK